MVVAVGTVAVDDAIDVSFGAVAEPFVLIIVVVVVDLSAAVDKFLINLAVVLTVSVDIVLLAVSIAVVVKA